uniref:C-type lectin domain-containing protein n=1 Tax=Oryzias melastigma TaxID=30732 RepID=A0A3B3BP85_ORYME
MPEYRKCLMAYHFLNVSSSADVFRSLKLNLIIFVFSLSFLHTVCQMCPKDWIQFNESCYFFYNSNSPWKTWYESRQFCQSKNSDLVVISSQEEQTFIKSTIEFYFDTWHGYWIGLRRINNNWIWLSNSTFLTVSLYVTSVTFYLNIPSYIGTINWSVRKSS